MAKPKFSSTGQLMTCCWVLADKTYCNKPTGYRMVRDDDANLVRKYNHFCSEHEEAAKVQAATAPSDDWEWEEPNAQSTL